MATWVLDLDGVLWRGSGAIPGSAWAVGELMRAGHEIVYCTNHARSPQIKKDELAGLGFPSSATVTSAEAAAAQCGPGSKVLVLGHPSLVELVADSGAEALDVFDVEDPLQVEAIDTVVVGGTDRWNRDRVGLVADAVRSGARFLATNDDPTYPVTGPHGPMLLPGNGALVAAVATAAGRGATITGKPSPAMVELLQRRHGDIDVVVGDRPESDGELASALGARFALVLSGVSDIERAASVDTWRVAADLAALVASELGLEPPRG